MRRTLSRLRRSLDDPEHYERARAEAIRQLTDDELRQLRGAMRRALDSGRPNEVEFSPEERRAYERFQESFAEALST